MSEYKKSNQDVKIGDIFVTGGASLYDECGSVDSIYQVTEKRGKTLVVLQQIKLDPYIDETCDRARGVVKLRPILNAFVDDIVVARAYVNEDGETSLWEVVPNGEKRIRGSYLWRIRLYAVPALPMGVHFFSLLQSALDRLTDYVEVDLSNQTLFLYTGGELILETPIVSGNVAEKHTTPGGAFSLIGKHRNVTLHGPDYASFVRCWMPFNNRIGLHDASWRSRFGGTIYKTNGSHGCINMPRAAAETVFETIDDSYAVVCYWRPAQ